MNMKRRETIDIQLGALNRRRDAIENQLEQFGMPAEGLQLLDELKILNHEIAVQEQIYQKYLHSPAPKPHLVATSFQVRPNHTAKTLDVAAVIKNTGDAPARGPFSVVLSASYTDRNGATISRSRVLQIPEYVSIEAHGARYVTEAIENLPLLYRNDDPKFYYDLEMIVDSDNELSEVTESDHYFGFRYW